MKYAIPGLAIFLFFSSCSNNSKSELAVIRATNESFIRSIEITSNQNKLLYLSFEDKLLDPRSSPIAQIWHSKAKSVEALSSDMYKYIDDLIGQLSREAGPATGDTKASYKEDNVSAVIRLFQSKGKGKELYEKLKAYNQDLLAIDTILASVFEKNVIVITRDFDFEDNIAEDFTKHFFYGIPAIAASTMLRMFENNVKIIENYFVTFCHSRASGWSCGYSEKILPIVAQSINHVKGGESIIITAGIGSFSVKSHPKVTIDGKEISANADGVIVYKFNTPVKAGKYTKAVKMEYTKPDGTKGSMTKNIEYAVIEPNQNPQ